LVSDVSSGKIRGPLVNYIKTTGIFITLKENHLNKKNSKRYISKELYKLNINLNPSLVKDIYQCFNLAQHRLSHLLNRISAVSNLMKISIDQNMVKREIKFIQKNY
jgi:hypothetical protein